MSRNDIGNGVPGWANYRPSEQPGVDCSTCDFFVAGRCEMFDYSTVRPDYVCDRWDGMIEKDDNPQDLLDLIRKIDVRIDGKEIAEKLTKGQSRSAVLHLRVNGVSNTPDGKRSYRMVTRDGHYVGRTNPTNVRARKGDVLKVQANDFLQNATGDYQWQNPNVVSSIGGSAHSWKELCAFAGGEIEKDYIPDSGDMGRYTPSMEELSRVPLGPSYKAQVVIPPESERQLKKFWMAHPDLRRECARKYGHDPVDDPDGYWPHGLGDEPEHRKVWDAVKGGEEFSLGLVSVWEKQELAASKKEAADGGEAAPSSSGPTINSVHVPVPLRNISISYGPRKIKYKMQKANKHKQLIYGVVLEPEVLDSQDDFMLPNQVEQAAHNYLKKVARGKATVSKLQHRSRGFFKNKPSVVPVESYIAPTDFSYDGKEMVKKGTWVMVLHVEDPSVWDDVLAGKYTGLSIGGTGIRQELRMPPGEGSAGASYPMASEWFK